MAHESMKEVESPEEIPQFQSEAEEAEFWANHSLGDWFFDKAEPPPENVLPSVRPQSSPLSELLDDPALARLKELAYRRKADPSALAADFILDRLSAEESQGDSPTPKQPTRIKTRDWQQEAYAFAEENEELLNDPDVDAVSLSKLAQDASGRMLEYSGEIQRASKMRGFPAVRLRRITKGYERLKRLTEAAISLYEEKFGAEGSEEGSDEPHQDDIRRMFDQAESIRRGE